ncbi:trypsin-like serine peptidase [Streptomyces sp. CB02923]|uniref:trypsin-like serine peptidase n=1 Tax=Streptomyces sp. CB02923 TaxID=1718985 RepID=UPI000A44AE55|nr:serine protease [Streptomyces sp. CB02923]
MSTTGRGRAPRPPSPGGAHKRRRTAALGLCAALTLTCAGTVLAVRAFAHGGFLAAGDPVTGSYAQGAADGDAAADALLSGPYTEQPGPPRATTRATTRAAADPPAAAAADPAADPAQKRKPPGLPVSRPLQATPAAVSPAVGPLFSPGGDGDADHHCTASVVHSAAGDLVVTAAHCVYDGGFRTNLVFAPGYHDGVLPYGVWVPSRIDIDPRWADGRDDEHDVAFVRVRRPHGTGSGERRVEELTGAERIRFSPPGGLPTLTVGYPDDRETPVSCRNTTTLVPGQLRFDCAGFPNGTSGGPMLTGIDPDTGLGTVTGVIGGLDDGGDDETSYSSWFGPDTAALYHRAAGERA